MLRTKVLDVEMAFGRGDKTNPNGGWGPGIRVSDPRSPVPPSPGKGICGTDPTNGGRGSRERSDGNPARPSEDVWPWHPEENCETDPTGESGPGNGDSGPWSRIPGPRSRRRPGKESAERTQRPNRGKSKKRKKQGSTINSQCSMIKSRQAQPPRRRNACGVRRQRSLPRWGRFGWGRRIGPGGAVVLAVQRN
jgi:hypothetical protein